MSDTEISRFRIPGFTYDLYQNMFTAIRNTKVPPSLYGLQAKIVADNGLAKWNLNIYRGQCELIKIFDTIDMFIRWNLWHENSVECSHPIMKRTIPRCFVLRRALSTRHEPFSFSLYTTIERSTMARRRD